MEFNMTANRPSKLISVLCGSVYGSVALAHPGHEHSQGIVERLLHAAGTEWLAPLLLLVLVVTVGYLYARKAGKE
jgi:hypothetical protein